MLVRHDTPKHASSCDSAVSNKPTRTEIKEGLHSLGHVKGSRSKSLS